MSVTLLPSCADTTRDYHEVSTLPFKSRVKSRTKGLASGLRGYTHPHTTRPSYTLSCHLYKTVIVVLSWNFMTHLCEQTHACTCTQGTWSLVLRPKLLKINICPNGQSADKWQLSIASKSTILRSRYTLYQVSGSISLMGTFMQHAFYWPCLCSSW